MATGTGARMMAAKLGMAALAMMAALAACARDTILEGDRFPVTADLEASLAADGGPAPVAASPIAPNASAPVALPESTSNAEWSHRGGSASHAGPHGVLGANPQRIWSVDIGAGNNRRNRITASPVVAEGRIFVMDAKAQVVALSAAGGVLWRADLRASYDRGAEVSGGGLAVAGGKVYATTGFGEMVALNAASGAVLWRQNLLSPGNAAPTAEGNTVYVIGRDGAGAALAADTGRILWQVPGASAATSLVASAAPAVAGSTVYFAYASGQIAAIDRETGQGLWSAAVAGQRNGRAYTAISDVSGEPVIAGDLLYAGSAGGRTVAIEAATGLRRWTAREGALNPPLVVGGAVFIVNDEARLIRLDAATGEVVWSVDLPYYRNQRNHRAKAIYASYGPVLASGRIVIVSSDGALRQFNPEDGALLGQAEIPGGAASSPALAGGVLYVMSTRGQLHAFR